jgi:predicted alpha/beta-fold hydrolase
MLAAVRARVDPATPVFAFGVSLGGSALLNWVGRAGADAAKTISAAAAASVPLDLMASGISIDRGWNRLFYVKMFLHTLKPKAIAMERRFPGLVDAKRVARATTLWEFDDAFTAPVHGFTGTGDYWTRASSKPWLRDIALPTLVLNARNDPFVPDASLPGAAAASRRSRGVCDAARPRRHPLAGAARHGLLCDGRVNSCRPPSRATLCGAAFKLRLLP